MRTFFIIAALLLSTVAGAQRVPRLKMADVVRRMNQPNDTTYIINFWATFCKPCVAEIPGFLKVAEKYKAQKVKLLLVSLDLPGSYPKGIADFVAKNKWKASIAWLNESNADIFCPMIDSSWTGGIPATVIVNAKRGYKKFWEGEISEIVLYDELKRIGEVQKENGYLGKFRYPLGEVRKTLFKDDFLHAPAQIIFDGATVLSEDTTVYALDDGIVRAIVNVEGMMVVVIENEGFYFTYSNLKTVRLKKGATIKANDIIGYAGKNLDGETAVDIYLGTRHGNLTLRKENFFSGNSSEFYSLPPKDMEPQ